MSLNYHRVSLEEDPIELRDQIYDYNEEYRTNLATKIFFDNAVRNVLTNLRERTSVLKRNSYNLRKKSINNISEECSLNESQSFRESKNFINNMIKSVVNKVKSCSKNDQNINIFNSFEFNKVNNYNTITAKKFMDISIKNTINKLLPLKDTQGIDSNIKHNEVSKKNSDLNNNENYYEEDISQNYKFVSEFLVNTNRKISKIIEQDLNLSHKQSNYSSIENKENIQFECNQFSRQFFENKIRKTITIIDSESNMNTHEVKYNIDPLHVDNINSYDFGNHSKSNEHSSNKSIRDSKYFMSNMILGVNEKIINEKQTLSQDNENQEKNSIVFSSQFLGETINSIKSKKELRKPSFIINPLIRYSIKNISAVIDEKLQIKTEKEKIKKSFLIEREIDQEHFILENAKKETEIKKDAIWFLNNTITHTLQKYNEYYKKLVYYTIKIQRIFRGSLWRFIFKIERMNLEIQKQNELAMAASLKRRSTNKKKKS